MNFVFIIDSSTSMLQYFDKGYSYFDAAKCGIENFIRSREMIKNKIKPDKYFLLTTDENTNLISSWTDTLDHLLFQLKILKVNYSFTNIENSIQTALNVINHLRKIGSDKHIHGRLVSKIQNTFIIIFTDGGKLTSNKKVFTRNTKIGLSVSDCENLLSNSRMISNSNSSIPIKNSELYSEPFRWDQNVYSFILNSNTDEEGLEMLIKYSSIIGGAIEKIENLDDFFSKIDYYTTKKFQLNAFNINLELNNNIINLIQQNEIKLSSNKKIYEGVNTSTNPSTNVNLVDGINSSQMKFINKNNFNKKFIVNLNVDFKNFKTHSFPNSTTDICFDRNESIIFKEIWPLPDDFLMSRNIKNLPKKRARPNYIVGNQIKFEFNVSHGDYDEYEVYDRDFIIKFLDNYPELTINQIKKIKNQNKIQVIWDVFNNISTNEKNCEIAKKPFAVLRLFIDHKKKPLLNLLNNDDLPLGEYIKKENSSNSNKVENTYDSFIKLKLCVLPYNYNDFFTILTSYNNKIITESDFIIQMEKYMKKIPYFYKPYVVQFLEKRVMWKTDEAFYKNLDEENLNENVISTIKLLSNEEKEKINELNKIYNQNKQLHIGKISKCCNMNIFKSGSKFNPEFSNKINNSNNLDREFINICSDLNSYLIKMSIKTSEKNSSTGELPIDQMGDYRDYLTTLKPLKSPFLLPDEIKKNEFKGDYFGNPFRNYNGSNEINNILVPNTNINDGESLMINNMENNLNSSITNPRLFSPQNSDTTSLKSNTSKQTKKGVTVTIADSFNDTSTDSGINSDSFNNINNNSLQLQLIDDDLTHEFKEMFNNKECDKNGTLIKNKIEIDMTLIYDWKVKEKLKECKLNF